MKASNTLWGQEAQKDPGKKAGQHSHNAPLQTHPLQPPSFPWGSSYPCYISLFASRGLEQQQFRSRCYDGGDDDVGLHILLFYVQNENETSSWIIAISNNFPRSIVHLSCKVTFRHHHHHLRQRSTKLNERNQILFCWIVTLYVALAELILGTIDLNLPGRGSYRCGWQCRNRILKLIRII